MREPVDLQISISELDEGSQDPHALVNVSIATTRERLSHILAVLHAGCDFAYSGAIGETASRIVYCLQYALNLNYFIDTMIPSSPYRTWTNRVAWDGTKWVLYEQAKTGSVHSLPVELK